MISLRQHAEEALQNYSLVRGSYKGLADSVQRTLQSAVPDDCRIHSIQVRAKSLDSFEGKVQKESESRPGEPEYQDPLNDITDLAGIRVITYVPRAVSTVCEIIEEQFNIVESKDVGAERFAEGRFGYQSIHYIVSHKDERLNLPEFSLFDGLVAEIQVRTILQHAWAELEHDIQYKTESQIPQAMQRRFVAMAGLLEIADREFQAIQNDDKEIRRALRDSLHEDLAEVVGMDKPTTTDDTLEDDQGSELGTRKVRDLVVEEKYSEAIDVYSEKLEQSPGTYTLYIGRAKAKFLNGDRAGALEDLAEAEKKAGEGDDSIARVRASIETGVVVTGRAKDAWQHVSAGNKSLRNGDGEEAFRHFSQAQQLGFHYVFSTINKAMARLLVKDSDGADYYLDQVTPRRGTPTAVNILALKAIACEIGRRGAKAQVEALSSELQNSTQYDYEQSPLRHLEIGFLKRDTVMNQKIEDVFKHIKNV